MKKTKHRLSLALGFCCAGLLLSSCTQNAIAPRTNASADADARPAAEQDAAAAMAEKRTQMVEPLWRTKLKVLAQPVVAGGVAVVLTQDKNGLALVGLNESTGRVQWKMKTVPGLVPSGVTMDVNVSRTSTGKDVALFLQKAEPPGGWAGDAWTKPLAVDVASGKVIYEGPSQVAISRPETCPDEMDMCYLSINPGTSARQRVRVDLDRGIQRVLRPHHGAEDSIFPISDGELYVRYSGKKVFLQKLDGSDAVWDKPLAKVMGPEYSTERGWNVGYSAKAGVYFGWIGRQHRETKSKSGEVIARESDFTEEMMVGIDASTGKVLWKTKGASTFCLPPMDTSNTVPSGGTGYPVRCVFESGTLLEAKGAKGKLVDGRLRLEGYDPLTGESMWKSETYTVVKDIEVAQAPADGGASLILTAEGTPRMLDTGTGQVRDIATDERFLCSEQARYSKPREGNAGTLLFPCAADGKPAEGVSLGAIEALKTKGGYAVLGFAGEVSGYAATP